MNALFCKNLIIAIPSVYSDSNSGLAKLVVPPLFQASGFIQYNISYCKHKTV